MTKIFVKTLQGNILPIQVNSYKIEDGFVCFLDPKTRENKKISTSNCEIVEEDR
jgi:hypothetical protein